ncbi:MAG TPA: hypothetical protein VJP59_05505 [Gemmatimonadota bacterium]|nr:hypothetical protein [Gemmatimonadota bacterium]
MQAPSRPGAPRPRTSSESGNAGLVLVAVLGLVLLVGFGGYKYLESTGTRLYENSEAMDRALRHLAGLEYMHPFTPPADGIVSEERAAVFEAVTAEAYGAMQGDLRKLDELDTGAGHDRPSLRGMADGIGALSGATLGFGQVLSSHDMALSEYLWTGLQLLRGAGHLEDLWGAPGAPPAPAPVLELAERHRALLDDIRSVTADSVEGPTAGTVYWMGWGMAPHSRQVWESPAIRPAAALIDSLSDSDSTGSAGSTPPRDGSPTPEPRTR